MRVVDLIAYFGITLQGYISILLLLFMTTCVTFQWRCGICGKINHTGLLKFLLCMCDHMGLN